MSRIDHSLARALRPSTVLILLLALLPAMASATTAGAPPTRVLVVGDSLSAAYGIPLEASWVSLLEARLERKDAPYEVINAAISGDTTRGGLARLPELLREHDPDVVVLELGGNDGLRGVPPREIRANLERMVTLAREHGARVLLVGMRIPPNYGPAYTDAFEAVYTAIARGRDVALVPFLLAGVAGDPALMQADGIHPEAAAQSRLLDNVWPHLAPLLAAESGPVADSRVAARPAPTAPGAAP